MTHKLNIGGPESKAHEIREKKKEEAEERCANSLEGLNEDASCPECGQLVGYDTYLIGTGIYHYCKNPDCEYLGFAGITTVAIPPEDDPWWDLSERERWVWLGERLPKDGV